MLTGEAGNGTTYTTFILQLTVTFATNQRKIRRSQMIFLSICYTMAGGKFICALYIQYLSIQPGMQAVYCVLVDSLS